MLEWKLPAQSGERFHFCGSSHAGGGNPGTVTINTTETTIPTTGITTLGYCWIKNLDPTNYFDIGPDSGGSLVPWLRVKPGEEQTFRLKPGVTFKAQANTAACKAQVHILEN